MAAMDPVVVHGYDGGVDRVIVRGLVLRATIGVSEAERSAPQRLRLDLDLRTDLAPAGASDDLGKAVDYGAVVEALREAAALGAPRLLEKLADDMAAALLARFGPGPGRPKGGPGVVSGLRLRLSKLDPALDASLEAVGVEIEREAVPRAPGAGGRVGF